MTYGQYRRAIIGERTEEQQVADDYGLDLRDFMGLDRWLEAAEIQAFGDPGPMTPLFRFRNRLLHELLIGRLDADQREQLTEKVVRERYDKFGIKPLRFVKGTPC